MLLYLTGLTDSNSRTYLLWSGIAGDAWLALPFVLYRKHNCHVQRCWRLGKHPVLGTPYVLCARHHPDIDNKLTKEQASELGY